MESQAATKLTVRVLENCGVSPPPGSVPPTALPLTFYDIIWLQAPPVQRLFFYQLPDTDTDATALLSKLKHSLSLALQVYYPFAGILTRNSETGRHQILFTEGDSVQLAIAQADSDFDHLVGYGRRDVAEFHPLAPKIPQYASIPSPVLALQVTLFPKSGLCIGITIHHVAGDGRTSTDFMKSWAAIYRTGDVSAVLSLPVYDRTQTLALDWIADNHFRHLAEVKIAESFDAVAVATRSQAVRATCVLTRGDIERLRSRITSSRAGDLRFSSFVLTNAYVWICVVKARGGAADGGQMAHFVMAADHRARLSPPLPPTYFGNCIGACFAHAPVRELIGEDGLVVAAESIRRAIQGMEGDGALRGAERWIKTFTELASERVLSVAGSPLLRVYDTQFGWGRPRKVEVLSIEETGAISLAENRDEEGGIEIGLAMPDSEMDGFDSLFKQGLASLG
ncbi:hypothetical protein ACLOJK_016117 [Asimina triloba]